ncbi:MAG: tRNA (N6-threonylcarbamoyladenosine(37)-N6)-methyltransferase TrmO [Candidatus Schmidhempelia sp.]|nr:tRNA (N6-threonylcarbamoyladenosine(37)-N6)-methyltransferase TrmO [Candidatus Schmidhempelia sp.]
MSFSIDPIGIIHSPYKEKFAIPRQPNLVKAGVGEIHLLPPYNQIEAVRGLEQFSHLWIIFLFHHTKDQGWRPTVRPPRLGGNERIGVFATRSTFRPNPVGISAVKLNRVTVEKGQIILKLGSVDILDGTPVIDIKPYIPYSDSYSDALAGYANNIPTSSLTINFSSQALTQLNQFQATYPQLKELITQVISQDPRPAYKRKNNQLQYYGMRLFDFNIHWQIIDNQVEILYLE